MRTSTIYDKVSFLAWCRRGIRLYSRKTNKAFYRSRLANCRSGKHRYA
jgi:hypothetical protein